MEMILILLTNALITMIYFFNLILCLNLISNKIIVIIMGKLLFSKVKDQY